MAQWNRDYDDRDRERRYDEWRDRWDEAGRERGMMERGADEVRSWFGDDDAERRRMMDRSRGGDWQRSGQSGRDRSRMTDDEWRYGSRRDSYERGYSDRYADRRLSDRSSDRYGSDRGTSGRDYASGAYGDRRSSFERGSPEPYNDRDRDRYGSSSGYGSMSSGRSRDAGGPSGTDVFDSGRASTGPYRWSYMEVWTTPGPHIGRGPRGYQRSDERIREDICERLTQHGRLDASDVEVTVTSGEVTLRGRVDSRDAKRQAEDVAESVPGVRDVRNELRTSSMGSEWDADRRATGEMPAASGAAGTTGTTGMSGTSGSATDRNPGSPLGLSAPDNTATQPRDRTPERKAST